MTISFRRIAHAAAVLVAVGSLPWLGFILQMTGTGSVVGLAVAYRAKRQHPLADTWLITARWTLLGLTIGVAVVMGDLIGDYLFG